MKRTLGVVGRLVDYSAQGSGAIPDAPRGEQREPQQERPTLLAQLAMLLAGDPPAGDEAEKTAGGPGSVQRAGVMRLRPCPELPG